jgi:hypothetical protein
VLGTVRHEVDPEDASRKRHNFELLSELTPEEFVELLEAQRTLDRFLQDSQLFMIVAWNYNEFIELNSTYLQAYTNKHFEIFDIKPININLNRAFINLLASIRS